MPILLKDTESEIRGYLKADIRAVWFAGSPAPSNAASAYVTFDTPPEVPTDKLSLPRAFCDLQSPLEPAEEYGSVTEVGVGFVYRLTLQKLKPKPGTGSVHDARMADADALMALLTDGPTYHGYDREWRGVEWDDVGEAETDFYTVTVVFAVFASIPAR